MNMVRDVKEAQSPIFPEEVPKSSGEPLPKKGILKPPTKELDLFPKPAEPTPSKVHFTDKKVRVIHTSLPPKDSDYVSELETPVTPTDMQFPETTKRAHKVAEEKGGFRPLVAKPHRIAHGSRVPTFDPTQIKELVAFRKTVDRIANLDPTDIGLEKLETEIKSLKKSFNILSHKIETLYSEKSDAFKAHDEFYKSIISDPDFQDSIRENIKEYVETLGALEECRSHMIQAKEIATVKERITFLESLMHDLQEQSKNLLSKKTPMLQGLVQKTDYQMELKEILHRHQAEIDRLRQVLDTLQNP